ncbi:peptidylprolyl isomerase [Blattabacterium cuenoti]|uniref:peptidylprolyl isomerase n=1 Tax=Blattabacterium cuenoti TaxID=1653831 RepID=UPI001EEB6533|nr:peptidylprolyl isomerase [Blattabacterium cuenoti]
MIFLFCCIFSFSNNNINKASIPIKKYDKIESINTIVGNEIILNSELKKRNNINENFLYSNKKFCRSLFSNESLFNNDLIIQKLMIHYAKTNNMKLIDQNIEENIQNIFDIILSKFDKSNKKKFFKTIINNKKEFIEKLIYITKNKQYVEQVNQYITKNIVVYPEEIKYLFENKKNSLPIITKKYMISYIVISPVMNNILSRNKIFDYLNKIRKKLRFSSDPCSYILLDDPIFSVSGCIIKKVKSYQFSKYIKNIIFSMKEKEITEPFETNFGYHLIKLEYVDKKKDEFGIRHIFIKKNFSKKEIIKTQLFANLLRDKINYNYNGNIKDFNIKKEKFNNSINIFIKNKVWVDQNNISSIIKNIKFLKKNSLSQVIPVYLNGKQVFFIIKILDFIDKRPINRYMDYIYLKSIVKNIKKKYFIINWAKEMLKKIYYDTL